VGRPLPARTPWSLAASPSRAPRLPTTASDRSIGHPDLTQNIGQNLQLVLKVGYGHRNVSRRCLGRAAALAGLNDDG
jgi:hypothetical protein